MSPNTDKKQSETNMESNEETTLQKCTFANCNKTHCRTPWHKPCAFAQYGLAERIKPLLVVVSGMEIVFGVLLIAILMVYGHDYDVLYATEDFRVITVACLNGSITLFMTGIMLIVSVYWKIRRLMLVYIFISTILGAYIFILSVFKIHRGLLIVNKDSQVGCGESQNFLSSGACLLGLLTLIGSAVHFLGNVVVFTYYNLKYIQPCTTIHPAL